MIGTFSTSYIIHSLMMKQIGEIDIPALVLYAECHPFFPDPEASINTIMILAKILDVKVNTSDIKNEIDKLRI